MRLAQTSDPDVDVEPLGGRIDRTVEDVHADVHLWVAEGKLGQSGGDVTAAEAGARAHAERPARRAPRCRELLRHIIHVGEDALRPAVDRLAIVRHGDAASGPVQEPDTEGGLQHADALADEGWRRAELRRGGHEAALAQDDAEQLQVGKRGKIVHDPSRSAFQLRGLSTD